VAGERGSGPSQETRWDDERVSTILELRGVSKRYGWRSPWVLSGADLSLEAGTRTSIVGANGSGKSTLLRIGAGVTSPSSGDTRRPRRVGYVPEKQPARSTFTGAEYLAQMGRIRGLNHQTITRYGNELLELLDVQPGPQVPWNNLSKGNRQKVVVAQAFLGRQDLIVLDEPYNGLDHDAHDVLDELISEANARGTSVLVSSHDEPSSARDAFRLVNGQLNEYTAALALSAAHGPTRRVELTSRKQPRSLEVLTQRDGVLKWSTNLRGAGLVLDVSDERCDDIIRAALDLGWSVRSVIPDGKDRGEKTS
jgi:ABC-2 type transport system ATP-binding protein